MIIVIADVDEIAALLGVTVQQEPEIVRPQMSGPCVHYEDGTPYRCTYPYGDGRCPHLDNPEILCPVKEACSTMQEIARMRDACEAEQEEQDADMAAQDTVYEAETPEFVEPTPEEEPVYEASPLVGEMRLDARGWTREEERAMREATTPTEAVALYRAAYPGSVRTDAAIKSRYYQKIRPRRHGADGPLPDFAGDTVPVTQCEGPAGKGLYGDARALHADMMDGMMCDRPLSRETEEDYAQAERAWEIRIIPEALPASEGGALSAEPDAPRDCAEPPHPWIGMRVRVLTPPDLANRTGTALQYSLDPREMLIALDDSPDRVWLPPESLVLVGAGRGSP